MQEVTAETLVVSQRLLTAGPYLQCQARKGHTADTGTHPLGTWSLLGKYFGCQQPTCFIEAVTVKLDLLQLITLIEFA